MNLEPEVYSDLVGLHDAGLASPATERLIQRLSAERPDVYPVAGEPGASPSMPAIPVPGGLAERSLAATQNLLARRSMVMGFAIFCTLLPFSFAFSSRRGVTFLLARDWPAVAGMFYLAGLILWAAFVWLSARLSGLSLIKPGSAAGWIALGIAVFMPSALMVQIWFDQRDPITSFVAAMVTGLCAGALASRYQAS